MRGVTPQLPWTARPVLFAAAQATRSLFVPRFGRQLRLEPIDGDDEARELTQYHKGAADRQGARAFETHDTLDLHLRIPEALCTVKTRDGTPAMPGSAVLALFDHFSTYAISEADRGLRPGVSVTLEGLFSKCRDNHGRELLVPGRTLIMRVAVPKIGTAVAFASADVTVDGFPVAQLSHIKYMPLRGFLGVAWALAFSPSGRWLTQRFGDAAVFGAIGAKMPKEPGPLVDDIGMLLELDDIQPDLAGAHALKAGFGPIRPEHTNPLGDLHGGCQAMLSEKLGARVAQNTFGEPAKALRSILMHYYRAGTGGGKLQVAAAPAPVDGVVQTRVTSAGGATLSAGQLSWHPSTL